MDGTVIEIQFGAGSEFSHWGDKWWQSGVATVQFSEDAQAWRPAHEEWQEESS